jgi:hypothetical protein
MRCFNHPDIEAVGVCKVCQKGLCHDCAADLGHSIVCKGRHEAQAQAIQSLLLRSRRIQKTAGRAKYVTPVFFACMGAIFVAFGLRDTSAASNFVLYLGIVVIAFAAAMLVVNRRAHGAANHDAADQE